MIELAMAPAVQTVAQVAVERVLNSLPEGMLLAGCAWLLLRLLGRQNAGTRFAVWLVTLVGVAGLPLLSALEVAGHRLSVAPHAEVTVPAFWAVLFAGFWILFAMIALARLVAGILQVRTIRKSCAELAIEELDPALRDVFAAAGERRVRLLISESARVPAAIGFRNPAIVLPAWTLQELPADELKPILIHEMAHLRRRDDWTNLLQKTMRALLFFHPAVWWIDTRLSMEREMACDDAVVAATGNAPAYAGSLIGLLERGCARSGWKMAQAAVEKARQAAIRIARILESGPTSTRVGRGALGLAAALCMTCCGLLEFAPQFVAFAPDTGGSVAHSAVPSRVEFPSEARAGVVPAMFHPAAPQRKPLAIHTTAKQARRNSASSSRPLLNLNRPHRVTPPVVMAKLDDSAPKSRVNAAQTPKVQMLMVMETSITDFAPVAARTGVGNAQTVGQVPVRVQTVQVLERDETGWHVHTYRVISLLPEGESMHSSI
jgi:beta-lactamase regulating signal transducer with metallopeptidase domain